MTSRGSALIQANQAPASQHGVMSRDPAVFHYRIEKIGNDPQNTLIVLDDELIGNLAIAAAKALVLGGEIAPLTIIAIGFGDPDTPALMKARGRYLTFGERCLDLLGMDGTGQGRELLDYLEEGIIPLTSGQPGKPSLLGYSLSASFALHATFSHGLEVGKIGAISPSLWAEPISESVIEQTLERETSFVLRLAAGLKETDRAQTGHDQHMFEKVEALSKKLATSFPSSVSWKVYEGETHWSIPFASIADMLRRLSN